MSDVHLMIISGRSEIKKLNCRKKIYKNAIITDENLTNKFFAGAAGTGKEI
jgi:hypothetical protein